MNILENKKIKFICQRTGNCCTDPSIIITLFFEDIFKLFGVCENNFERLLKILTFYKVDDMNVEEITKLVLPPVKTTDGLIIFGLRKDKNVCYFYFDKGCKIYNNRPLACQNYPFTFQKKNGKKVVNWAKGSLKKCNGIGKGSPIPKTDIINLSDKFFWNLKQHQKVIEEINNEYDNGKPLSSREALVVLLAYAEKIRRS